MRSNNMIKIGLALLSILIVFTIGVFKSPQLFHFNTGKIINVSPPVAEASNPFPPYYSDKVVILNYHNLDDNETDATISPVHFREQIEMLTEKGYNFISLQQLGDFLAGKQEIAPNAVVITFDDGYQSVYKYAYPLLAEKGIPASIFVIVKNVGATSNQIPKLTWDQMKEMQSQGMTFYSHSYNSHRLVQKQDGSTGSELTSPMYLRDKKRNEDSFEYEARIKNDLLLSKTLLESEMNAEVDYLALPYGFKNDTVKQLAQEVGYHYLLTVDPGFVDINSDRMALKRIAAGKAGLSGEALHKLIISYVE